MAFTGMPVIAGEERTREVFGDQGSIYDAQQSAMDGATVRLFCENRTPEVELVNPELNEDNRGVVVAGIEQLPAGNLQRPRRMDHAVDALISPRRCGGSSSGMNGWSRGSTRR